MYVFFLGASAYPSRSDQGSELRSLANLAPGAPCLPHLARGASRARAMEAEPLLCSGFFSESYEEARRKSAHRGELRGRAFRAFWSG